MKKLYMIGNLKMNMSYAEIEPYLENLIEISAHSDNVVGVCIPSVYLDLAKYTLEGSKVLYGAQNMHYEDNGAYTGEISAHMLNDFNCDIVIVGHSERRNYFGETDADVNLKIKKALETGLTPIVCFGENLEERQGNMTFGIIEQQITGALEGLNDEEVARIIFAYEPVWAIGTGLSATGAQAEEVISFVKRLLSEHYNVTGSIVLYGGSLKPSNAMDILSNPSIDGGLIGGACLKVKDFEELISMKVE